MDLKLGSFPFLNLRPTSATRGSGCETTQKITFFFFFFFLLVRARLAAEQAWLYRVWIGREAVFQWPTNSSNAHFSRPPCTTCQKS